MDGRVVLLMTCLYIGGVVCTRRPSAVRIDNNGYKNILVAVHPDVPEDHSLVDAIQRMITDASSFLHQATERRAYFSDVTILVPGHWTNDSWGRASAELYTNADVVVETSDGNTSFDDVLPTSGAYTKTFGGCGVAGDRIVLFTDIFGPGAQDVYGELGRLFVHEWAHFRYGVFDEFAQRGEQQFYFSPASGRQEAVKCNRHLAGQVIRRISNESDVNCSSVNPQSGMYDDGCFFQPVTSDGVNANVTSSIMDTIKIPSVVHFCNDNATDTNRIHNYEAPSRHNRLCGGKSSWSVISENQDFRHGKNPPREVADTRPTFRVVRLGTGRQLLLAVDTSSSMKKGNKLTRSRQAISTFIGGLDPGVLLGVISFASSTEVLVPLTRITDDATRETIVKMLPSSTQGQTNISSALSTALEVLASNGSSASGTFLVLITDGKDTSLARLGHVMRAVRDAGVVTSLISFSSSQVPELELLAESTGGRYYYDMESETSTLIYDAMLDIYLMLQPDRRKIPVQIVGESKYLDMSGSMTGSFKLDSSVGRNTRAIITYSTKSPPNITVMSPTGRKYCSLYPEYSDDSELHQVKITVPALAEVGRWTYNIVNEHQVVSLVSFLVTSSARSDHVTPLQFSGALLVDNSSWPVTAVVTAEAVRDRQPVRYVRVTAWVTRPAAEPVEIQLFDNGIGADILAGDGIYSRYFTHFTTAGLYTASIEMVDDKGEAIAAGDINTDPSMVARTFTGSVRVEHPKFHSSSNQSMDECPPMRITDLRVLHTSQSEGLVVLSWTAPGDDADIDRASSYTILMASDAESMVNQQDLPEIDPEFVVQGNLKSPKHFGEKEQVTLKLKTTPGEKRSFVFSVFAVDEGNNKGEISNLVTVGLGFVPDFSTPEYLTEVTKPDPDTSTDSSQKNLAIAVVVGISAGLLAVTIVTTFCIHFVGEMKRKSLENKLFHSGTNSVV